MTTTTARMGLKRHTTADNFDIADYAFNWAKLDEFPGIFICTSGSRPTGWTGAHTGVHIFETDTALVWRWDGSAFVRSGGKGRLATGSRTTLISTSSTTPVVAVSCSATVPAGGRPVLVVVSGPSVSNPTGITGLSLWRDATQLQAWEGRGIAGSATAHLRAEPIFAVVPDVPSAGARVYALQFNVVTGFANTSTLDAGVNNPLAISVIEV